MREAALKDIEHLLKEAIAQVCGIDAAAIQPNSRLADLGVDSLATAEVLVDVEIRLGRQLPSGTLRRLEQAATFADVAALFEDAFGAAPPGAPS